MLNEHESKFCKMAEDALNELESEVTRIESKITDDIELSYKRSMFRGQQQGMINLIEKMGYKCICSKNSKFDSWTGKENYYIYKVEKKDDEQEEEL